MFDIMAPCAVCVVAISGGLGISRALGIDDAMTGVWVGALLLSLATLTVNWLKKKWPSKQFLPVSGFLLTYLLILPFFFTFDLFANSPEIFGYKSLALGMIVGTIFLALGLYTDQVLRRLKADDNKGFFPFQKVFVPVFFLLLATLMMWFLTS